MISPAFDPDTTCGAPCHRRQPTAAEVLRDLRNGDAVRVVWAPDAVASLVLDGVVYVSMGWAKLVGRERKPDLRRGRYKRLENPFALARAREARMLAMLPATSHDMAMDLGISIAGVVKAMRRLRMVRVGGEPVKGGGRPRDVWGRP